MNQEKYRYPIDVPAADEAFPAKVIGTLLPKWDEIPQEFRDDWIDNPYARQISDLFFRGKTTKNLVYREHIREDAEALKNAPRHLMAVLRSFEPKHEHKTAGAAYLLSLWCEIQESEK